ncbi:Hsp20/alpha crystallin family protein [Virgibacillus indicus]|nr:Hsp20/alpha crystallin family protein [Virgibacillus indicus]
MGANKGKFPDGFDIDMRPLHDFMKKMDSFFNESFKQINSHFHLKSIWTDVEETDSDIIVKVELPGYKRDQIHIEIIGNRLRISVEGMEKLEAKNNEKDYYSKSQSVERKEKIVTVPFIIPEKETSASFKDGLLKIIIPKKNSNRKYINLEE